MYGIKNVTGNQRYACVDIFSLSFFSCRFYVDDVRGTWGNGSRTDVTAGMKVRWLSSGPNFFYLCASYSPGWLVSKLTHEPMKVSASIFPFPLQVSLPFTVRGMVNVSR